MIEQHEINNMRLWHREDLENFVRLLDKGSIKEALLMFMEGYRDTTFAEIEKHFGNHIKGDVGIGLPGHKNVIIWLGITEEFAHAVEDLLNERKVEFITCPIHIYLMDGKLLNLPLVTADDLKLKQEYDEKVWFPVMIKMIGDLE